MALYFLIDSISPSGEGLTRVIQRIKSTLNQISYIVERFTSLSKFYSINELVIRKNIDIYTLITSLLEVRPEHKGIILYSNSENMVESDYVLLQLIFQNLIENAIKYRIDSESSITININRFTENILRIDISNSLDKNITVNLEKIFDMYYRGANVKNEPGMGVGIWITREIVKKIKGEINVSRDGDRVIFSVYIPISFSI
jgi:K+-sensing histidine kinase KdpD